MMIIVADFYRTGNEHVPVNAGLLYMTCNQFATSQIHFYGEQSHIYEIQNFWKANTLFAHNLNFHVSNFKCGNSRGVAMVLKRIWNELTSIWKLSSKVKKEKPEQFFFLSLSSVSGIFLKIFFSRKIPVIVTLHGDVEFIRLNNDFTRNFLGRCFRFSFRIKKRLCRYLVLDEVIKTNLLRSGFLNDDELIAIPHPYIFKYQQKKIEYYEPFKIAHIGVASIEKQSFYLFRIAAKFNSAVLQKRLVFLLIGKNENIDKSEINEFVCGAESKGMLSRDDFEHRIAGIHYAIFFYNDIYQLTGSGAILDAFNFEKPIIALRNELFSAIFERAGNIGFLCNDITEIESVVERILNGDINKTVYEKMQLNMKKYKEENSLEKIQARLFSQVNLR